MQGLWRNIKSEKQQALVFEFDQGNCSTRTCDIVKCAKLQQSNKITTETKTHKIPFHANTTKTLLKSSLTCRCFNSKSLGQITKCVRILSYLQSPTSMQDEATYRLSTIKKKFSTYNVTGSKVHTFMPFSWNRPWRPGSTNLLLKVTWRVLHDLPKKQFNYIPLWIFLKHSQLQSTSG